MLLFDEPYQIINGLDYRNTPLAPLSNLLGNLWGNLVGFEWIKFRYLAYGLNKLSILIGLIYMYSKTKDYWNTLIVGIILFLISTLFPVTQNLYGWDAWTLPLLMVLTVLVLEYIEKRNIWYIVLIGIISPVVGYCRIPNFVLIPFACFIGSAARVRGL
jgi:hypothetical protein